MNTNNLKIAWRAAWKTKLFTTLNILGLAIGFAGFILAYAYINRENSYDAWNDNYENIYLVGLENGSKHSDLTPTMVAPTFADQIPEIALAGRVSYAAFEVPFISDERVYFMKSWLGADRSIAEIFQVETAGMDLSKPKEGQTVLISPPVGERLFPNETSPFEASKTIALASTQGLPQNIDGITKERPLSNLNFECIGFVDDLAAAQGFGTASLYQTYIQVKPGANIEALTAKINQVYAQHVLPKSDGLSADSKQGKLYLDALKNLHLRPQHGSTTGYYMVLALGVLSVLILVLACINFANLMIVQAQQRAKEIGVKKIFGVSRKALARQFLFEVFIQCLIAAFIALFFVLITWNTMRTYFQYDFAAFEFSKIILLQLGVALFSTTLFSGLYPALMLSGYRPVAILKGNFQSSHKTTVLRNGLLTFQFVIAFIFISTMLIVGRQLDYINHSDKGFSTDQVLYVKNMALYNSPEDFDEVRTRLKSYPGVQYAAVSSNVPGGNTPKQYEFLLADKAFRLDHIAVDGEYFETLDMTLLAGRLFQDASGADTSNIIINRAAAKVMGIKEPIGKTILRGETSYRVIGLVQDSKMEGFEQAVRPTVYTPNAMGNFPEGVPKVEILIKLSSGRVQNTLQVLQENWHTINPKDGELFNYEFLDQKYAHLHADQEKLKNAFTAFAYLILLVALIGLFAMSAYAINLREKEVGIRKVLGADIRQIIILLNKPFIRLVAVAILIATPIAWWGANQWLNTFAYRIELSWWIFVIAAAFALTLAFITVSYQTIKAAFINPVKTLKNE